MTSQRHRSQRTSIASKTSQKDEPKWARNAPPAGTPDPAKAVECSDYQIGQDSNRDSWIS